MAGAAIVWPELWRPLLCFEVIFALGSFGLRGERAVNLGLDVVYSLFLVVLVVLPPNQEVSQLIGAIGSLAIGAMIVTQGGNWAWIVAGLSVFFLGLGQIVPLDGWDVLNQYISTPAQIAFSLAILALSIRFDESEHWAVPQRLLDVGIGIACTAVVVGYSILTQWAAHGTGAEKWVLTAAIILPLLIAAGIILPSGGYNSFSGQLHADGHVSVTVAHVPYNPGIQGLGFVGVALVLLSIGTFLYIADFPSFLRLFHLVPPSVVTDEAPTDTSP